MPSFQNAAPGAKSMKFADAMDPFAGFLGRESNDGTAAADEPSLITKQLDTRLRFTTGSKSVSQASNTAQQQMSTSQFMHQRSSQKANHPLVSNDDMTNPGNTNTTESTSEDDSDLDSDDEDNDAVLVAFRQKRLAELKQSQRQLAEHKANGHGQVRIITQDEFLTQCTSSRYVAVHFFHKEFPRCQILSHHLKRIAPLHLPCKFVEIDAEKAPFFVVKLKIQTLPTLIVFRDGKAISRLVGFEDLADCNKNPDEFPTSRLGYWLEKTGAIEYEGPISDDEYNIKGSSSLNTRCSKGDTVYDEDV
jgi:thiol-disulfide isomerase/thioredoxin